MEALLSLIPVVGPMLHPLLNLVKDDPTTASAGASALAVLLELVLRKTPSKKRLSLLLLLRKVVHIAKLVIQVLEDLLGILDKSIDGVKLFRQNLREPKF